MRNESTVTVRSFVMQELSLSSVSLVARKTCECDAFQVSIDRRSEKKEKDPLAQKSLMSEQLVAVANEDMERG